MPVESPDDKAQRLFDAAIIAEEVEGDLNKALELYREVAELDKDHPHPVLGIADILRDQSQWKEAIQAARKVTKRWPNSRGAFHAYLIIGDCYHTQRQFRRAERAYRQALEIEQSPWPWVLLSSVLVPLDREGEAITCLQNALKIDPDYEEAHYNLGVAYGLRRQYIRAEKHLRRAIEIDPKYALAYTELASTLLVHKMRVHHNAKALEAIRLLKKSIKLNPDYIYSWAWLANALWGLKKIKDAHKLYRKLVELWPYETLSHWCYGGFLAHEGIDDSLAEQHLRKAVKLAPNDEIANYYLGKELYYWDRDSEAIKYLNKAAKKGHRKAIKILGEIEEQNRD
jgi:tetratricopeptide (TPR) repeat protein